MKHQALVLKVADYSVVRVFPFEKAYFFHKSARAHLGNVFRFGLVAPITTALQSMLRNVQKGSPAQRPASVGEVHAMQRYNPELEKKLLGLTPMNDILQSPGDYFMVIPILMRGTRVDLQRTFAYLYPRKGSPVRTRSMQTSLGMSPNPYRDTYAKLFKSVHVLFEHEEIKKPCVFCRHAISGMAGSCLFGSRECHKKISFAGSGQFQENMRKYREMMTNFPDRLKGVDHGSVSVNDD